MRFALSSSTNFGSHSATKALETFQRQQYFLKGPDAQVGSDNCHIPFEAQKNLTQLSEIRAAISKSRSD